MINYRKTYFLLLGAALLIGGLGHGLALAADCTALSDGIRKERVLMKKKALIDAALQECPRNPDIAYQNGYVLERLRKYEDALVSYKKAISLDAGYAKAYFSIGDIHALLNNYRDAVDAYTAGLALDPDDKRAHDSLLEVQAKYKETTGGKSSDRPVAPTAPVIVAKKEDLTKSASKAPVQFAVAPIVRLSVPFSQKNTTELSLDAQDVLSVVVGQAMNREDMLSSRFEVGGHTDNLGDAVKNDDIAKKRADIVHKYLTDSFSIDPKRLKVASYGQRKPKVPNSNPTNQEINRRVDFTKLE